MTDAQAVGTDSEKAALSSPTSEPQQPEGPYWKVISALRLSSVALTTGAKTSRSTTK